MFFNFASSCLIGRIAFYNIFWYRSLSYSLSMSTFFTIKESPSMNDQSLACRHLDFRLHSRILGMAYFSFISDFRNSTRVTRAMVC